jgi:mannitol-1-phosphate/altronate dehydrogenase
VQYVCGYKLNNEPIDVQDPLATELAQVAKEHAFKVELWISDMLCLEAVFGNDLKHNEHLRHTLIAYLERLRGDANITVTLSDFLEKHR